MTAYEFIFSEKRKHRLMRHFSFWVAFCISRIYLNYYPGKPANILVLSTYGYTLDYMVGYLPVYLASVYVFIYFLVPRYLHKKKYLHFIARAFIMGLFNFIACALIANLIFKMTDTPLEGKESFYAPLRAGFYQGVVLVLSMSAIASGIKITKSWYLQQIENTRLVKLKNEKEIKLLKSQIHPVFLFESLKTLHKKIIVSSDDAPLMVLQLSELLSYLLYDSKDEFIALNKEIEMLEILIALEKSNKENRLRTELFIDGDKTNKYIVPLSLFVYLQNSFAKIERENMVTVNIQIKEDFLNFHLSDHNEVSAAISLYSLNQQ